MTTKIKFSEKVKLIISDVDETIAGLYVEAVPAMIKELEKILSEGKVLFLITGQSVGSICWRIVNHITPELRKGVLVGHCSGAEVWGFDEGGNLCRAPFYSIYETTVSESQKRRWREIMEQLTAEFKLKAYPTMPIPAFEEKSKRDPLSIMVEDRGPQITFEVVNGYDLSAEQAKELTRAVPLAHCHFDLRIPILERAEKLFAESDVPITPRLAGVFAIDFAVRDVSKTTAVKYVVEHESILISLGLTRADIADPARIEVWGDKFSVTRGGTDRHISEALPKEVRSITFREEDPKDFPEGYNIIVWDGEKHLSEGLLEFLKSRRSVVLPHQV